LVSGRVRKPGVYLAPAGITMRELIDEYCGGMLAGHEFYGYFRNFSISPGKTSPPC
jgi:formate dehydrogenase beta subunit